MRFCLTIIILFICFCSCRKNDSLPELKKLYKSIEGDWSLKEYHYSSSWSNPNGYFTRKVDVSNGIKIIINTHSSFMYYQADTTSYNYSLNLSFNKYTLSHKLEYTSEEILNVTGQNEEITNKEHISDWSEMRPDSLRLPFPEGLMNFNSDENKLLFQNNSYTSTLSTQGSGTGEYIFIRK